MAKKKRVQPINLKNTQIYHATGIKIDDPKYGITTNTLIIYSPNLLLKEGQEFYKDIVEPNLDELTGAVEVQDLMDYRGVFNVLVEPEWEELPDNVEQLAV